MTNDGAGAQEVSSASAAKVCEKKIPETFGNVKHIGPVEALHGVTFRRPASLNTGPDIVPERNVRLFRARFQNSNFLGMSLDHYAVCFFEVRGSSYRFVQVCVTKDLTSTFVNCDMNWMVSNPWYDKVQKERKESR